ncbi:hypothetical protein CSV63_09225 [Sporosarcina sp. P34]|uniref:hypothetical protein n=1 Tax=Sporosarcina sp. P34 TaxID=2048247 RepID=UPI000C1704D3|nr:hypothetical protein [Sporosarcina sp. P34]PID14972.1 hypothetical protein CSV63_09225 [Sporosarcina sp. P34]
MTAIIATRSEKFSIIISDTRENSEDGSSYKDGVYKLRYIPRIGFISGAGLVDFLDMVKEEVINKRKISSIVEFSEMFDATVKKVKNNVNEHERELVDNSYIVIHVLYELDNNLEYYSMFLSNSYINKENEGSNGFIIDKGQIRVIYPKDLVEKEKTFQEIAERVNKKNTVDLNINQALLETIRIFTEITRNSEQVSSDCQIGIQYYNDLTKENHTEGLYGDAEKFLELALRNKLVKKFRTVESLQQFK